MDSSGSIGRRKWPLLLDFLNKVINEFNIGPDGTHVAVVAYSTNPKLEFPFNAVSGDEITAEEYGKRIDRITYQRGYTYIDKALKLTNEQVFVTSAGMRSDVPKVWLQNVPWKSLRKACSFACDKVWVCFVSLNYVKRTCRFLFDSEDTDVLVSLMGGLE